MDGPNSVSDPAKILANVLAALNIQPGNSSSNAANGEE